MLCLRGLMVASCTNGSASSCSKVVGLSLEAFLSRDVTWRCNNALHKYSFEPTKTASGVNGEHAATHSMNRASKNRPDRVAEADPVITSICNGINVGFKLKTSDAVGVLV